MNAAPLRSLLVAALAALASTAASAEEPASSDVTQANNPIATFTALNFHNYYLGELTGSGENGNTLWARYAKPFSLGDTHWLSRTSLPVNTYPVAPDYAHQTGIGDLNFFAVYLLDTGNPAIRFGMGPQINAPTATEDSTGSGKWSAGIAANLFIAT